MELIKQITEQLGVDEATAKGGAGLIFDLVKSQLSSDKFEMVATAVPEASTLLGNAPEPDKASTLAGGLMSSLTSGGGQLGAVGQLTAGLSKLGLDSETAGKFLPVILQFVQSRGGGMVKDLVAGVFK